MAEPETTSPPPSSAATSPLYHPCPNNSNPTKSLSNSHPSPPSTTVWPPSTTVSPPQSATISVPLVELQHISSALSAFQTSFNDLHLHLNTLKVAVDGLISSNQSQNSKIAFLPPLVPNFHQKSVTLFGTNIRRDGIVEKVAREGVERVAGGGGEGVVADVEEVTVQELKTLCESMNFRGLKRYLVMNLKDIGALRLEVPKLLKFAPNPAKFVLECAGRFYLQGSKAYVKGSQMLTTREASVLILECFLLMEGGGIESGVEEAVKEEADRAAMLWKKRIIGEGGIMKACEIDARGLLLLIGCYGVPQMFNNIDVRELLRASNVREIAGTLRRSSVLMAKVPGVLFLLLVFSY